MAGPGNVRDLLQQKLGVPVSSIPRDVNVPLAGPATQIAAQRADRVAMLIVNLGAFNLNAAPQGGALPSSTHGILLQGNGGGVVLWWEQDGELPAYEWLGLPVGGTTSVFVLELVLEKAGKA